MSDHHWVTFHRLRFADIVPGIGREIAPAPGAEIWWLLPAMRLTEAGVPAFASDVWGAMGVFGTEAEARAMFDDPAAHIPMMADAVDSWHALAVPYAHHGAVHWRDGVETNSALRVSKTPPEGALAIVTSAGYDAPGFEADKEAEQARRLRFAAGVMKVMDSFASDPGNLQRDVVNGAAVDGRDGFTLSLWADDAAMMAAAYKAGVHRSYLDEHKGREDGLFDRSCFTRLRIVDSHGDWPRSALAA
ncbi:hypothetical protein [Cognatishimia sp. F0-27]|uniref:hypothetical protein n=1 Tax=Cognatishimia sp. F0-27 TaxID=2816855 RepID=UPI001D0C64A1|nr:hypothetical protein [Cognatishimia sp. F0-27]MCC1493436.1 hypothetical protein [Cognatishimia sp. F0-27]